MSTPNTSDEWNNILHLFNISHFSFICCAKNCSLASCTRTMAKRMQEQEGEERIVAKWKLTLNLASLVSTNSSTVQSPIASKSSWILKAPCQKWLDKYRETWSKRIQSRRSFEFSSMAIRRSSGWTYEETRRFRKLRHQRQSQNLSTQFLFLRIQIAYRTWRMFSRLRQRYGLSPRDKMGNRCERSFLGYIHVRHSLSSSSSGDRLYG